MPLSRARKVAGVCLAMKPVGKPDAGNLHVRFDERGGERSVAAWPKPPRPSSTLLRRQKNDAADAAGICEAVTRPSMRFVGVRTLENQAALMHHKAREMLVAQRTQLINALRGHLAEIGVIASSWRKATRRFRPACARRSPRSCVNCMLWIRRSHAAIEPSPRWLEATKWRAA